MVDKEKVIKGLSCHSWCQEGFDCNDCPYLGSGACSELLAMDALALLKEQETTLDKEPIQ